MHALDEIVRQIDRFPTLPDVALRVARALDEEEVDLGEVAQMISLDPSLSGRIIKLANSALFGASRPAESVQAAMFRLGIREVKSAVLAVAVMEVIPALPPPFDLRRFWVQALACALIARKVARDLAYPDPEEAYLAALVHELGVVFLIILFTDRFQRAAESCKQEGFPLSVGLTEEFGCDQSEVCARLLTRWNFPIPILEAVRYQLTPESAGAAEALASLVFAADHIARDSGMCITDGDYEPGLWVDQLPRSLEESLSRKQGISIADYIEQVQGSLEAIEDFASSVFAGR